LRRSNTVANEERKEINVKEHRVETQQNQKETKLHAMVEHALRRSARENERGRACDNGFHRI
jgi:hypothetical protein